MMVVEYDTMELWWPPDLSQSYFPVILVSCLSSLSLSAIRAMISKCVEEEEQGT